MKSHRLKIAVLLAAVASLLLYGALPAFAAAPDAPTGVTASASEASAMVGWVIPANNGGSAILNYTVTPTPACGGCTGTTVSGATASSTTVSGLTDGTAYTFTVHATNADGSSGESSPSGSVTPTATSNNCNFNSFPAVPSASSELSVNCVLTTAVGAAGNDYRIEDFPQASWSQGAGRTITTTAATAATSANITSAAGHFAAQDVNDTITGTGIPSNTFIKSVTSATVAVLDKVVGGAGVPNGAKLIVSNSDGRTATDGIFPASTVAAASNGVNVTSFTGTQTLTIASILHFATGGGQVQVATSDPAGAILSYTTAAGTTLTHVNYVSGSGTLATGGRVSNTSSIYSTTAHFCKVGLAGCNSGVTQKNDVGKVLSATLIPHGDTISAVNSATSANITTAWLTTGCPAGTPVANCAQIGLSSSPTLTNTRQIKDATYAAGSKVCSVSAGFAQSDVNLPIANVGAGRIPANDYITSISGTCAVLHATWTGSSANASVVIGSRSVAAPVNGDAVMSLSSELSVSPSEAAGEPSCSFGSAVGSNLIGKWNNPGSFDLGALGQPSATQVNGPVLAQLDVTTGTGNPAFAGYVVPEKASTPGESDTAAHVDIIFPSLLTGVAVCPEPNNVGVATSFRFFGETLTQSAAGNGNVRSFQDLPANTPSASGTAWEHVIKNSVGTVLTASGNCTDDYPTTSAGFSCGGQ